MIQPTKLREAGAAFLATLSRTDDDSVRLHQALVLSIEGWVEELSWDGVQIHHGLNLDPPGQLTTTEDKEGFRLGLHIDSWDGPGISGRDARTNRICLNLGPGHRYLLVVPDKIDRILGAIDATGNGIDAVLAQHLAKPDTVVCAVRVDPGEAYIGATEALIHDASTLGSRDHCVTYTVRGWLRAEARSK